MTFFDCVLTKLSTNYFCTSALLSIFLIFGLDKLITFLHSWFLNLRVQQLSDMLCLLQIWPVLAVIGGTDRGLRMGGRCFSKLNMKRGTILGVLKEGSPSVKVLWDESDAVVRCVMFQILVYFFCLS